MVEEYGSAGEKASAFWLALWDGNWGPQPFRPLFPHLGRRWEQQVKREGIPTRNFPNRPCHVCFVSEYMRTLHREAGIEFPSCEIIYRGVPVDRFYGPLHNRREPSKTLRILYAGQISPDRGLPTAVEAIGHVPPVLRSRLRLSVAAHTSSDYFTSIKRRFQELGLMDCVSFLGKIPHGQMPQIYKQNDVLVFPSTRPEGFPLTMIEAMLAGCAVLSTGSGGAMEIAKMADLPLFPKGDHHMLGHLLTQLITDRDELYHIASRGQAVALREFNIDRMMHQFIAVLQCIHDTHPSHRSLSIGLTR